jgi:hypothetical protein
VGGIPVNQAYQPGNHVINFDGNLMGLCNQRMFTCFSFAADFVCWYDVLKLSIFVIDWYLELL